MDNPIEPVSGRRILQGNPVLIDSNRTLAWISINLKFLHEHQISVDHAAMFFIYLVHPDLMVSLVGEPPLCQAIDLVAILLGVLFEILHCHP